MFRPFLSPPRGDIEAPYCTEKKVDLPRQKTEKKVSQSNGRRGSLHRGARRGINRNSFPLTR